MDSQLKIKPLMRFGRLTCYRHNVPRTSICEQVNPFLWVVSVGGEVRHELIVIEAFAVGVAVILICLRLIVRIVLTVPVPFRIVSVVACTAVGWNRVYAPVDEDYTQERTLISLDHHLVLLVERSDLLPYFASLYHCGVQW